MYSRHDTLNTEHLSLIWCAGVNCSVHSWSCETDILRRVCGSIHVLGSYRKVGDISGSHCSHSLPIPGMSHGGRSSFCASCSCKLGPIIYGGEVVTCIRVTYMLVFVTHVI